MEWLVNVAEACSSSSVQCVWSQDARAVRMSPGKGGACAQYGRIIFGQAWGRAAPVSPLEAARHVRRRASRTCFCFFFVGVLRIGTGEFPVGSLVSFIGAECDIGMR